MDRLQIDIQFTDIPRYAVMPPEGSFERGRGTIFACGKIYDPNSKLMKLLLPIFIERITKAFSLPGEFVQNGLVFDFLNDDKTGLLDQIEDKALQKKISEGMRDRSTYYLMLKIEAGETVLLKAIDYMDKNRIASRIDSIQGFVVSSSENFI